MSWIDERIQMRKENDQIMFENSFNDLAGIKNIVAGEEKDLRGNFICCYLFSYSFFRGYFVCRYLFSYSFFRGYFVCCYLFGYSFFRYYLI